MRCHSFESKLSQHVNSGTKSAVPWAKHRTILAFHMCTNSTSASYVVASSSRVWSHWSLLRETVCSAQACRVQLNSASRDAEICTESGATQSPLRRAVFWRPIPAHFSSLHPSTYVKAFNACTQHPSTCAALHIPADCANRALDKRFEACLTRVLLKWLFIAYRALVGLGHPMTIQASALALPLNTVRISPHV